MGFRIVWWGVLVVALAGCGGGSRTRYLRRAASSDLSCPEKQIHLTTTVKAGENSQYLAEGCARRASYQYTRQQGAVRVSSIEGVGPSPSLPPPPGAGPVAPAGTPPPPVPGGRAPAGPPPPPPPPPPAPL